MTSNTSAAEKGGSPLSPAEVRRGLRTRIMGQRLILLERTGSTTDLAWREAQAGAPEGTVILAEEQTHGRGRMGRRWHCPPGTGLLMSLVLRPELGVEQGSLVTVTAAVAVTDALRESLRLPARIRWPNDIMIRGRKVAGILVEGRSLAGRAAFVLGMGINVNATLADFGPELSSAATSLAVETEGTLDRATVARWVLLALDRWYGTLRGGDYGCIAREWRRLSSTLGHRVVLSENGREYRGRVLDLSLEDGLIVRLDSGLTRVFHPATVTVSQLSEG